MSYPSVPPAPRAPVFARSLPQQPQQGYGFGQQNRYPAHYSQAPAAPHSLSPMAMSSVRNANGTGPQRAQPTVVIRSRPTVKMGLSILVAGTLLGAVFGIGMRVRQNAADAAFAAEQQEQELQQAALATPPPQAPIMAPVVINPTAGPATLPQGPAAQPPNAYAGVPFGSLVVSPAPQTAPAPAPAAAAPAAAAAAQPKAPQKHVWWGKPAGGGHPSLSAKVPAKAEPKDKDKDDGYKVASAGNDEPAPKAKPAKEPAVAKDEPKETKKAEARPAKSTKSGSDDADKVLKAAMGATENTL